MLVLVALAAAYATTVVNASTDLLASPRPPTQPVAPPVSAEPPTAAEVAIRYGVVGRELTVLEHEKGMTATIELWPRYRWIRINEWLTTPARRAQAAALLERLRADIHAAR